MSLTSEIRYRLRALLDRQRMEEELRAELSDHIAREAAANELRGMTPADARRHAVLVFGGAERFAEETRGEFGWQFLDRVRVDVRHSVRRMVRSPLLSLSIALIAATGIGAASSVFSLVSGILLRPLPFEDAGGIEWVRAWNGRGDGMVMTSAHVAALETSLSSLATVGAYASATVRLGARDARVERTTGSLLSILGARPLEGRWISPDDEASSAPVILLSERVWRERFGARRSVVGSTVPVDGVDHVVIGVMPAAFKGPMLRDPDAWVPLRRGTAFTSRAGVHHMVFMRRRTGVQLEQVSSAAARSLRGVESGTASVEVVKVQRAITGDVRGSLLLLLGAVGVMLALVCTNLGTLLLARARSRQQEMSVRHSLGSSRARLVQQVVTETFMFVLPGALLALMLTHFTVIVMRRTSFWVLPRMHDVVVDWRVVVCGAAATIITGCVAAIIPIVGTPPPRLAQLMNGASESRVTGSRWNGVRSGLLSVQIALTVILLAVAGLMVKGFLRVLPIDPGFQVAGRVAARIDFSGRVETDRERAAMVRRILADVARTGGVRAAAAASFLPFDRLTDLVELSAQPGLEGGKRVRANQRSISSRYVGTMGMGIVAGRDFNATDTMGAPAVVLINETGARRLGAGSVVGRMIAFRSVNDTSPPRSARIVGVVNDTRTSGTDVRRRAEVLLPYEQAPTAWLRVIAWHDGNDDDRMLAAIADATSRITPPLPVSAQTTVAEILHESVQEPRLYSSILAAFAGVALILAASGIFSVLAFTVSRRAREIAIRRAMGMPAMSIALLVLADLGRPLALGVLGGIVTAGVLTTSMSGMLLEVSPHDPAVFGLAVLVIAVSAGAACALPVLRAVRLDPAAVLRQG